jgi:hypothetical protein
MPPRDAPQAAADVVGNAGVNGNSYGGGPVMTSTSNKLYYIWYGDWSGNPGARPILEDFASNLGGSPYWDINTTNGDTTGQSVPNALHFGGSISVGYTQGSSLTGDSIAQVVKNAIQGGSLPSDPNGIYFVLTSKDVTLSGFCSQFCGWHTYLNLNNVAIKYAFAGSSDQCGGSCGTLGVTPNGNAAADDMASIIAHESEETATDPLLNAWTDANGENADKCAWKFGTTYKTANGATANMRLGTRDYLIQENWLNLDGGSCALSYEGGGGGGVAIGGSYAFHTLVNPSSCMDLYENSPTNGTQIEEYACNGSPAQTFTAVDAGNGLVNLVHPSSGKCVDLYAAGTANGTKVELYDCNGTAAQQFAATTDAAGNVTFQNPHSGRCLDVQSSGTANLTKIQLWDCNGTNAQKWAPAAGGLAPGATYAFHTLVNPSSCMDLYQNSSANFTQIEEYACNGSPAQTFTVVDAGDGLVNLVHPSSGKCVDLYSAGTANGTKVELYDCNGTPAQQFAITADAKNDLTFVNPHSGRCLDVQSSGTADLTKVQLWDCNGTSAQKWAPAAP